MSYKDITTIQVFSVQCSDCDFAEEVGSAGAAEALAHEHINNEEWHKGSGCEYSYPNYEHSLSIAVVTRIGRNV